MKALALAVRFLTVLPWPGAPQAPEAEDMARALARFPFVGLLVGAILIALDWALSSAFSVSVRSAVLIVALIALTRGSSLRGFSDFADEMGFGSRSQEAPGSMGVLLVLGALLLKFVALSELHGYDRYVALLLSPVLARAATAYLIASPPSLRKRRTVAGNSLDHPAREKDTSRWAGHFCSASSLDGSGGFSWPSWPYAPHGA